VHGTNAGLGLKPRGSQAADGILPEAEEPNFFQPLGKALNAVKGETRAGAAVAAGMAELYFLKLPCPIPQSFLPESALGLKFLKGTVKNRFTRFLNVFPTPWTDWEMELLPGKHPVFDGSFQNFNPKLTPEGKIGESDMATLKNKVLPMPCGYSGPCAGFSLHRV